MTDDPMTAAEFADQFAAADHAARTGFVADLWAALGWETTVDGAVVTAERSTPAPERRRLLVPAGDGQTGESLPAADAVIAVRDPAARSLADERGAATIDAADLRNRALYGADRSAARELTRRYFGREFAPEGTPDARSAGGSVPERDDGSPSSEDSGGSGASNGGATEHPPSDALASAGPGPDADESPASDESPERTETATGDHEAGRAVPPVAVLVAALVVAVGIGLGAAATGPGVTPAGPPTNLSAGASTPTPNAGAAAAGATPTTGGAGVAGSTPASEGAGVRYASLEPTCERPPGLVIEIQLGAIRHNDETENDAGIRAARRFASPANREVTGSPTDFVRLIKSAYAMMLRYERASFGPLRPVAEAPGELTQRITLTDANGTTATYRWTVAKQSEGRYAGCWMTAAVTRESPAP